MSAMGCEVITHSIVRTFNIDQSAAKLRTGEGSETIQKWSRLELTILSEAVSP